MEKLPEGPRTSIPTWYVRSGSAFVSLATEGSEVVRPSADLNCHNRIRNEIMIPGRISRRAAVEGHYHEAIAIARVAQRAHQGSARLGASHFQQQDGHPLDRTADLALIRAIFIDEGLIEFVDRAGTAIGRSVSPSRTDSRTSAVEICAGVLAV